MRMANGNVAALTSGASEFWGLSMITLSNFSPNRTMNIQIARIWPILSRCWLTSGANFGRNRTTLVDPEEDLAEVGPNLVRICQSRPNSVQIWPRSGPIHSKSPNIGRTRSKFGRNRTSSCQAVEANFDHGRPSLIEPGSPLWQTSDPIRSKMPQIGQFQPQHGRVQANFANKIAVGRNWAKIGRRRSKSRRVRARYGNKTYSFLRCHRKQAYSARPHPQNGHPALCKAERASVQAMW